MQTNQLSSELFSGKELKDIERFRSSSESDQQWMYRKLFIETYWNEYNEERLLCLAQCYANTKCLGCKYSEPLKTLLEQLEKKLILTNNDPSTSSISVNTDTTLLNTNGGHKRTKPSDEEDEHNAKKTRREDEMIAVPGQLTVPLTKQVTPIEQKSSSFKPFSSTSNFVSFCSTPQPPALMQLSFIDHPSTLQSKPGTDNNVLSMTSVPKSTLLYDTSEMKSRKLNIITEELKNDQHQGTDENDVTIDHFYKICNKHRIYIDYRPDDSSHSYNNSASRTFFTQTFHGKLYIDDVFICAGQGPNKKSCKQKCFLKAYEYLVKHEYGVKSLFESTTTATTITTAATTQLTDKRQYELVLKDVDETFSIPTTHPMSNSNMVNFVEARDKSTIAERTARQQFKLEQNQYYRKSHHQQPSVFYDYDDPEQQLPPPVPPPPPRKPSRWNQLRSMSPPPPVPHQQAEYAGNELIYPFPKLKKLKQTTDKNIHSGVVPAVNDTGKADDYIKLDDSQQELVIKESDEEMEQPVSLSPVDSASILQQRAKLCKLQPFVFSLLNSLADPSHAIDLISTEINKYHLQAEFECADHASSAQGFHGHLIIEQICISEGYGTSKKLAKKETYANALKSISQAKSFSLELKNNVQWMLACHQDIDEGLLKCPPPPPIRRRFDRPPLPVPVTLSATSAIRYFHERLQQQTIIPDPPTEDITTPDLSKCVTTPDDEILLNIQRLIPNTFVVFEPLDFRPDLPGSYVSVLFTSMSKNRLELKHEFLLIPKGFLCTLYINDQFFMSLVANTKTGSKQLAAMKVCELLKSLYPSIKMKSIEQASITQESAEGPLILPPSLTSVNVKRVTRVHLFEHYDGSFWSSNTTCAKEDVATKLMKKMGWDGGGIGKQGQGIAEPIQVEDLHGRKGLGSNRLFPNNNFIRNLRRILEEFIQLNNDDQELLFINEFNNEERKTIHKESMKLNLQSTSYGQKEQRYIRVQHKRTTDQLIDHLLTHNGNTKRYELKTAEPIKPKDTTDNDIVSKKKVKTKSKKKHSHHHHDRSKKSSTDRDKKKDKKSKKSKE
ncbi:unnamed protein product [Didymodactylos carnosus]|uniref:G-patch domain-containing protein n=1 Tax=Didymodactylos carnosus TaxID=1234261 RepID=A0A813SWE9_9BILA|nr:unnamed protein product [Didymodactylos carnosus]CAF0992899.1 unnamed protein product [Didymodactylos carnosus]CAF3591749.1 unnamed protein product [Didymodactylos carnosus]CAF3762793.1 unnamed protein product [Didymodactylos carnosus]